MKISLGFSPCPNDTYMFAALVHQWIDTKGFEFNVHMEDVEQLNEWAGSGTLDVTKMSFHRALSLETIYDLLPSGAALGNGCGPLLIAKQPLTEQMILEGPVALPGLWTTAHLLFNIFYKSCQQKEFHLFSDIEDLVVQEKVRAGVIIHENRFTYQAKGLVRILDLGEAWENHTGLPIPLGGIFAHTRLPLKDRETISGLIRESIEFAQQHQDIVMPYVKGHAQEMQDSVIQSHIGLYVNEYSLDLGEKGYESLRLLKKFV